MIDSIVINLKLHTDPKHYIPINQILKIQNFPLFVFSNPPDFFIFLLRVGIEMTQGCVSGRYLEYSDASPDDEPRRSAVFV